MRLGLRRARGARRSLAAVGLAWLCGSGCGKSRGTIALQYLTGYGYTVARVPYADMQQIQAGMP